MPGTDVTINAEFEAAAHVINVSQVENGTVTASPNRANAGETITLTVMPAEGYILSELTVTTVDKSSAPSSMRLTGVENIETTKVNDNTYTFVMPDADINVNATFAMNQPTAITDMGANVPGSGQRYNLMGQPVGPDYRGIVIVYGKKLIVR